VIGDRPGIPLEGEPLAFCHPLGAGNAAPGPVQPAGGPPFLEEEPALWPEVAEVSHEVTSEVTS
jgi:hypothetical protein